MRKLLLANPYEEHWAAMLVYHVATICSMIARAANPSLVTASLLIFSSVIAFEAILWVVAAQLWCFIIVNVTILLVAVISYYKDIYNLLTTRSQYQRTHDSSDTVASEGQVSGDINYGVSHIGQ
ncbi:Transmembrane protein, putative [Arachis hypogaea]|nr:Transmembrane protein, putative [Arachis hypogaea]